MPSSVTGLSCSVYTLFLSHVPSGVGPGSGCSLISSHAALEYIPKGL